jgi:putative inorganic carbon (hco3(-)) transporter
MSARAVRRPGAFAWVALGLLALAGVRAFSPRHLEGHWLALTPVAIVAGVAAIRRLWDLHPAPTMCAAIVLSVFSGAWHQMGLGGLPLDRALILLVVAQLLLRAPGTAHTPRLRLRNVHVLMCLTLLYALGSAVASSTATTESGFLSLFDQLGVVPYAMFLVAPSVFAGQRERNLLLVTLVALGAYLGLTAIFETFGPHALVFPRYILRTDTALTGEARAGGPFQAVIAEGFATFACAVACVMAFVQWRERRARWFAGAAGAVSLSGCLLTLERGVWIGALAALAVVALTTRAGRRRLVPAVVSIALTASVALAISPALAHRVSARTQDQTTVWDRQNQIAAGLRMLDAKPLFGFGWDRFTSADLQYFRQAPGYPMVGYSLAGYQTIGQLLPLHETYLSYAVELGVIGALLWLVSLLWSIGGAILARGPSDLRPWKVGLIAVAVCFMTIALFNPYQAAFPVLLLWIWGGVALGGTHPAESSDPARAKRRRGARWALA